MAMDNERFRAARERTASLNHPDEGLSRRDLAELANAWIWDHHKTMTSLDANPPRQDRTRSRPMAE